MSFLSDVFHGNFSNLGTDLSHDPVGTGLAAGALALGTAGLAAPAIGSLLGGGELAGAAAGGIGALPTEAAATGATLADAGVIGAGGGSALLGLGGDATAAGIDPLVTGVGDAASFGGPGLSPSPGMVGMSSLAPDAGVTTDIGSTALGGTGTGAGAAGGDAGGLGSLLGKNPLATAVAGGGLLYNLSQGGKNLPTTNAIQTAANQSATTGVNAINTGQTLQTYLQNGTLPPNIQTQVNQQVAGAKAAAIARAANMGMPTDPTRNSSLASELSSIDQQGLALAGQYEQNLFQAGQQSISQGAQFLGISNQDLIALSNIQQNQQANIGKSIASFAAALGGGVKVGTGSHTITIGA